MYRTLFSYGVCEDGYCNYSYRSWSEHASSKKIDNGGNATCLKTVFIFAVPFVAKSRTSPLISREHICEIPPGSERSQRVQGVKKIYSPPPPPPFFSAFCEKERFNTNRAPRRRPFCSLEEKKLPFCFNLKLLMLCEISRSWLQRSVRRILLREEIKRKPNRKMDVLLSCVVDLDLSVCLS